MPHSLDKLAAELKCCHDGQLVREVPVERLDADAGARCEQVGAEAIPAGSSSRSAVAVSRIWSKVLADRAWTGRRRISSSLMKK